MSQRWLNVLTAAGLVALLAVLSLTAPMWSRLLRRPVGGEDDVAPSPSPKAEAAAVEAQRTIKVKLYFEGSERPGLVTEEREVPYSDDVSRQLRSVVEALVAGSAAGLQSPLPPATRVLDVFVTPQGTAYVDLSSDVRRVAPSPLPSGAPTPATGAAPQPSPSPIAASSHAELMAAYAIVDTLTVNFPAVKRVQLLVEGQPVRTLWGHVDLGRPLPPDLSLVAGEGTAPGAGPWRDPEAALPSPEPAPSGPPAAP